MIDKSAREKAVGVLERFVSGDLNADGLDYGWPVSDFDISVDSIGNTLYICFGGDPIGTTTYPTLNDSQKRLVDRCLVFLRSDHEYAWPGEPGRTTFMAEVLDIVSLGTSHRQKSEIEMFTKCGDIEWWPFTSGDQYRNTL
jgi:hypothetical protein